MNSFDSLVWGPYYWFFLHTICMNYQIHPTEETKKIYYHLFQHFHYFIPIQHMANQFKDLIALYPITPYLDNRESILKWIHFIHNRINIKLEKKNISYEDFFRHYHNLYKPTFHQHPFIHLFMKKIFSFFIVCLFIYFAISFSFHY